MFKRSKEPEKKGSEKREDLLVSFLKDAHFVFAIIEALVSTILNKSFFWQKASSVPMTARQMQVLNIFLDGYEAKITSKSWAALAKCSKDTAIRDIQDLIGKNVLREDIPGAKRPSYSIVYDKEDLTQWQAIKLLWFRIFAALP